ncbi:MAG: hypothetical protein E7466_04315 [Ruminococcaceae bacterium]|nr:hypothetical protein [Oscillospiraceae bacterium]
MKKRAFALVLAALLLAGCNPDTPEPTPTAADTQQRPGQAIGEGLVFVEYSSFSGAFPEDGSGRKVSGVAAMLIRNDSGRFLDHVLVDCKIGSSNGTFKVTGLAPKASVWVLEQSGRQITAEDTFHVTGIRDWAFRDTYTSATDQLKVTTNNGMVTVQNLSENPLHNVCIYYKNLHTDGNFFGGITYLLSFDALEPGQSLSKRSSHYGADSQIVRYSFQ